MQGNKSKGSGERQESNRRKSAIGLKFYNYRSGFYCE
jgi:hypothetical protein